MLTEISVYKITEIIFFLMKRIENFQHTLQTPKKSLAVPCRIHVAQSSSTQWISGKGKDSGVPSTRNANLIGSWILSSARNYYLRYKSGDLPRLPSSQRASLTGPAVIIRVHTLSRLSRTLGRRIAYRFAPSAFVRAPSRNARDYPQVLITNLASANYN